MPRREGIGPMGVGSMTERGLGLACRRGFGRSFAFNQTSLKTQKELLQEQKTMLQERLEVIDKQVENL